VVLFILFISLNNNENNEQICVAMSCCSLTWCRWMFDRTTVANLNHKISAMQTETVLLREELSAANTNLLQQQNENSALRTENTALLDGHRRQMQVYYCFSRGL